MQIIHEKLKYGDFYTGKIEDKVILSCEVFDALGRMNCKCIKRIKIQPECTESIIDEFIDGVVNRYSGYKFIFKSDKSSDISYFKNSKNWRVCPTIQRNSLIFYYENIRSL